MRDAPRMRPLDDTRPGDLVALDFYGENHHLVIAVSFSSVWRIATIRRGCSLMSVPLSLVLMRIAAGQREQAKFGADRASSRPLGLASASPSRRGCMVVPTPLSGVALIAPFISWLRTMAVGLAARAPGPSGLMAAAIIGWQGCC